MTRCAIYTRKSTDEGLEQEFNSLDAQREAGEAYIRSQRHEGWRLIPARFDDGGYSGGTMDRPSLRQLLEAVRQRSFDVVVVYKVDRLTRSLADFAKIVELFDAHGVSFVSVTQPFNTTTSMGRLTLNVLLSFAQFEREVTAERIRDKIAASKQKGMWMGGPVPLGYDVHDRQLIVNEEEAPTVRLLFNLYLELGSVRLLQQETFRRGLLTKCRHQQEGRITGGKSYSRGNLYQMLSNPIYVGRIPHKGQSYPGLHTAIIDTETWAQVQQQLRDNSVTRQAPQNVRVPSLLAGLVFDDTGDRLSPSHASKQGRRYRYYISHRLMTGTKDQGGWRLPSRELDRTVVNAMADLLSDHRRLFDRMGAETQPALMAQAQQHATALAAALRSQDQEQKRAVLCSLAQRVEVMPRQVKVSLGRAALATALGLHEDGADAEDSVTLSIPIALQRRGVEARLVIPGSKDQGDRDPQLCRLVAQAHCWFHEIASGTITMSEIAAREGVHLSEVSRCLPLAFLAPDIVEAILDGRHPKNMTAEAMRRMPEMAMEWSVQRSTVG